MNYRSNRNYENYRNSGSYGNYMNYGNSRKCNYGNYGKWGKIRMGSRNLRTQQIWLFDVIIKFGSLMSSLTFGSLMPFDENVEKRIYNS